MLVPAAAGGHKLVSEPAPEAANSCAGRCRRPQTGVRAKGGRPQMLVRAGAGGRGSYDMLVHVLRPTAAQVRPQGPRRRHEYLLQQ
jgi:hypothetical protein